MIKSTHPDFERLIAGESVVVTAELTGFLDEIGVDYQLEGQQLVITEELDWLDPDRVLKSIETTAEQIDSGNLQLDVHRVVGSTNDLVMQRLDQAVAGTLICTAEMQTAGKGRRGRQWVSPFGRNVYLTLGTFLKRPLAELGGLSLVVGMQVADSLRQSGLTGATLKWPNDLLLGSGKMGGILVELKPAESRGIGVVAGVGINLSLSDEDAASIDQPWTAAGAGLRISRNDLVGVLAQRISAAMQEFDRSGFEPFMHDWNNYNRYFGEKVSIHRGDQRFEGKDCGVDASGNLLLETPQGLRTFNSGEVSLRALPN